MSDTWAAGGGYEPYIGRWSRLVAQQFVPWLRAETNATWLDVGCGTGALTTVILDEADPAAVLGIDPSPGFLEYARARVDDARAVFRPGDAATIPADDDEFDVAVSGLVLNFVPDPAAALQEIRRVTRPGGRIGVYLWDYGDGMQLLRLFWDAALERDPSAPGEAQRFPLCRPEALHALFQDGGLADVTVEAIDVPTVFRDFDDYWTPFLGGQGPGPTYVASLNDADRADLRERLRERLTTEPDGSIALTARAWAARGSVTADR